MNFREEFNLSIRARCAVLYVTTREEERLLSVVKDCAAELENMRVVSWDFASGFDVGVAVGKGNPIAVLDFIAKEPADTPILYVLKDFHRFLEDNMVCRMVKNLAAQLKPQQKSILIVSPVYKVPEELTSSVSVLEFQLPTLPELREYDYQYNMPVHIGRTCWIGAGAVILPGVTVGDNTVIGAGSVVTKDIPANVVAVGNPCRVLRPISDRDKKYYFRDHPIDHAEIARDLEEIK